MPDYACYCGSGFFLPQRKRSSIVEGTELFCSVGCFLKYVVDLPFIEAKKNPLYKSPFVSETFDVWDEVTGEFYRSWYEVYVARCLCHELINFTYETHCISIHNSHYTPDFWLPNYGFYIEVKGLWGISSKKKFQLAAKLGNNMILLPWHLFPEFRKLYGRRSERSTMVG